MRTRKFYYVYELDSFYTTGNKLLDVLLTFYIFIRKKINLPYVYNSPKFHRIKDLKKWDLIKKDTRIIFGKIRPCGISVYMETEIS